MYDYGAHPPFAHNPHVYDGVDPAATQPAATQPAAPGDAVFVGEQGPELVDPAKLAELAAQNGSSADPDDDAPVDVDGDGQITGYEAFSKADLIAECERLGLPTYGNKPDLVRRLQQHDAAKDSA